MKHSIASGTSQPVSHKIRFLFLKTAQNPFSSVKFLFHKDGLTYRQAILDIICIQLAQKRYKLWPLLNTVKTSLILHIFCATTFRLQYLITTCCMMYIYSSDIFRPQFFGHLHEARSFDVSSLCVNIFCNSLHI
jgi:hypothetical protein